MAFRSLQLHTVEAGSGVPSSTGNKPRLYVDVDTGIFYFKGEGDAGWAPVVGSISGVATGYKVARGETVLGGSNPTAVAHGLTTCIAFSATLKGTAAPGVGTSVLTANISGANVNVYAWKPTSNANPTLIASTGTESFYWVAVGV